MALSVKGLAELIQANQALAGKVRGAMAAGGAVTKAIAAELDARRKETATALTCAGGEIELDASAATASQQKKLLQKIAALEQQVEDLVPYPDLQGIVLAKLSSAYMSLANTYSASVATILPLTKKDQAEIASLLGQAELDTQQRRRWAAILGGATALVKASLKAALAVGVA